MINAVKKIFSGQSAGNQLEQLIAAKLAQLPASCRTFDGINAVRGMVSEVGNQRGFRYTLMEFLNDAAVPFVGLSVRYEAVRRACAEDMAAAEDEVASAERGLKGYPAKLEGLNGRLSAHNARLELVRAERAEITAAAEAEVRAAAARLESAVIAGDSEAERLSSEAMAEAQAALEGRRSEIERIDVRMRALKNAAESTAAELATLEAERVALEVKRQSALLEMSLVKADLSVQEHLASLAKMKAVIEDGKDVGLPVSDPRMSLGGIGHITFWVADARRSLVPEPNSNLQRGAFPAAYVLRCLHPFDPASLAELERFLEEAAPAKRSASALAVAA